MDSTDKRQIEKRLLYYLNLFESEEDWLARNATKELLVKVYARLSDEQKESGLEELMESI